jgi:hypothetical protein
VCAGVLTSPCLGELWHHHAPHLPRFSSPPHPARRMRVDAGRFSSSSVKRWRARTSSWKLGAREYICASVLTRLAFGELRSARYRWRVMHTSSRHARVVATRELNMFCSVLAAVWWWWWYHLATFCDRRSPRYRGSPLPLAHYRLTGVEVRGFNQRHHFKMWLRMTMNNTWIE